VNSFDWDDLRYFLAVADAGSLSGAARRIGSNQPTVGRRIDALEAALGMRLFLRTSTGLIPTPEGSMLLTHAEQVRGGVLGVERLLDGRQEEPQGKVRLALPEGLCQEVVLPALGDFYAANPRIRLILNVSARAANLTRGEADVAIRLFRPRESDLVARRIGRVDMGLYASSDYLERRGRPESLEALAGHSIIAYGDDLADRPENQWLLQHAGPEAAVLSSDSTSARRRATEEGLGISVQPRMMVREGSGLLPVLEGPELPWYPIWLAYHRDLRGVYPVRALLDFLSHLFGAPEGDPRVARPI